MSEIITIKEDHNAKGHFRQINRNAVEFRLNDTNYLASVAETEDPKVFEVLLNGKTYTIQITNDLDELIAEMGLNILDAKDAGDIFSPMPGLVIDIMVKGGDVIKEGQPLAILEAMKMENIIKASGTGFVEEIAVEIGHTVDKGQLLISIKSVE
jgi:biotin carboxyl carrier protein